MTQSQGGLVLAVAQVTVVLYTFLIAATRKDIPTQGQNVRFLWLQAGSLVAGRPGLPRQSGACLYVCTPTSRDSTPAAQPWPLQWTIAASTAPQPHPPGSRASRDRVPPQH